MLQVFAQITSNSYHLICCIFVTEDKMTEKITQVILSFIFQTLPELLQHGPFLMQPCYGWSRTALCLCSRRAADFHTATAVVWGILAGLLFPFYLRLLWLCSVLRRTTGVKVKSMLKPSPSFDCTTVPKKISHPNCFLMGRFLPKGFLEALFLAKKIMNPWHCLHILFMCLFTRYLSRGE